MNLILLAAEVHEHDGESLFQRYWELVTDPAHLLLELTLIILIDVIIGMIAWPFAKKWLKEHDRKKHAHEHCDDVHQGQLFQSDPDTWTDI